MKLAVKTTNFTNCANYMELLYKEEVYKIIGAAIEVHKELGPGFLEAVYQEALQIEFDIQNIPCVSQPKIDLYYKNNKLEKYYVPDFLAYDNIVIEIKSLKAIGRIEEAQIIIDTCR